MVKKKTATKGLGKGKQTKAIHLRCNGWGIGDYDSFNRDGEIVVGQLGHIDMVTGIGTFRGFVIGDQQAGGGREGQEREWNHLLTLNEPTKVVPYWVLRYEGLVRELHGNN